MYLIKKQAQFHPAKLRFQKDCGLSPSWHGKNEPGGEPLMPLCMLANLGAGASIRLLWCLVLSYPWGEGVLLVKVWRLYTHPGAGFLCWQAMFILIHILSSWHHQRDHHHNYATTQQACGMVWANCSPKFTCYMSLRALQNTRSTGCFLLTLAYWWSYESVKRKLNLLFLIIQCLFLCWKFLFCWHW